MSTETIAKVVADLRKRAKFLAGMPMDYLNVEAANMDVFADRLEALEAGRWGDDDLSIANSRIVDMVRDALGLKGKPGSIGTALVGLLDERKRLRELARACYAGLVAECDLPDEWADAFIAASQGDSFAVEGLLPYAAQRQEQEGGSHG